MSLPAASTSARTPLSGSKRLMPWAISSMSFLRSAISASRMASWNWFWKSAAMIRTLRVHCPSVRRTAGNSLGPITISATTPMSRNSVQEMSSMETPRPAQPPFRVNRRPNVRRDRPQGTSGQCAPDLAFGLCAPLDLAGRLVVDRLHRRFGLRGVGDFLVGHALLEGLNALGDIAHHVRNLAAPAEDQQQDGADDEPVPDAQRAHEILRAQARPR